MYNFLLFFMYSLSKIQILRVQFLSYFSIIYFGFIFLLPLGYADRLLIIKYKASKDERILLSKGQLTKQSLNAELNKKPLTPKLLNQISAVVKAPVVEVGRVGNGGYVIQLYGNITDAAAKKYADKLMRKHPNLIDYVEVDRVMTADNTINSNMATFGYHLFPNDLQWDMMAKGDNFIPAWHLSSGKNIVIAEVDTGYTPNHDIVNQLLSGYTFLSGWGIPNHIGGLDRGNFCTRGQKQSNWHGTHIAGDLVGSGQSSDKIIGGANKAKLVPIRVLAGCNRGMMTDVVSGIYWAIDELQFVARNNNIAKVINISISAKGRCSRTLQDAIDAANDSGAIVVVSAGNDSQESKLYQPANCNDVIVVSARNIQNNLTQYSNWGNVVITASGGDGSSGIYSSSWNSKEVYNASDGGTSAFLSGTSMAAPHVSAAVADILSWLKEHNNQIYIPNKQKLGLIKQILQNSATSLNSHCINANIGECVPNLALNAGKALEYVKAMTDNNLGVLIPDKNPLLSGRENLSQAITFTPIFLDKVGSGNVEVGEVSLWPDGQYNSGIQLSFELVSDRCKNRTISSGTSCGVVVREKRNIQNASVVTLRIKNKNGQVISTVVLVPAKIASQISATKSGGCAMIQGGNDASILLLLLILVVWYGYVSSLNIRQRNFFDS